MADAVRTVVKGTDWGAVATDQVFVRDLVAMGQALAKDITDRIRRGVGTDNKPLPPHHVKLRKIRERWAGHKASYWTKGTRKEREERRIAAKAAKDDRDSPISVIQQLRTLGGHTERPAAGVTWVGYDNVIRYGRDARGKRGETEGGIAFYQWNTKESFLAGNYTAHVGVRTGEMLRAMTVEVSRTKAGRWWIKVGPKGRGTRSMPMFRLLEESKQRKADAEDGRKPRKWPASCRMAMLQRMGPGGKIAASADLEIGVLDPTSRKLSEILQETIANPLMQRINRAPRVEVKA
jgi:hypothetical protein